MVAGYETARTRRQLSLPRQRLLQVMQTYGFCRLRQLKVRAGEPILDESVVVIHDLKIGGSNGPRPERSLGDFVLKDEHLELFGLLDEIGDGEIEELEVKFGLPCRMFVKRRLALGTRPAGN
jgi:hypothetical protein